MKQFMFIVPEALMDQSAALRDAFELITGERVLDFGPAQWRDARGKKYSISAGLLDADWIAQLTILMPQVAALQTTEGPAIPDPEAIIFIETDTPHQKLETLGLSLRDEAL